MSLIGVVVEWVWQRIIEIRNNTLKNFLLSSYSSSSKVKYFLLLQNKFLFDYPSISTLPNQIYLFFSFMFYIKNILYISIFLSSMKKNARKKINSLYIKSLFCYRIFTEPNQSSLILNLENIKLISESRKIDRLSLCSLWCV